MTIRISNRNEALKNIKNEVIFKVLHKILPDVKQEIEDPIIERFLSDFGNHPVIQSLLGEYEGDDDRDLQAQVGLTSGEAVVAIAEIGQAVRKALRVNVTQQTESGQFAKNGVIKLTIFTEELEEAIRGISSATYDYVSKRHGNVTIYWLRMILDGSHGEVLASINFELGENAIARSRSHRAHMINNQAGWSLDKDILCENKGLNFIEDVLANKALKEDLEDICKTTIERMIKEIA